MNPSICNKINFLKSCFEHDFSSSVITDIFSKSVEYPLFINDRERLLMSELQNLTLEIEKGLLLEMQSILYRKEKDLLYCSFFITGKSEKDSTFYCFPLVMYACDIASIDIVPSVNILSDEPKMNYRALQEIIKDNYDDILYDKRNKLFSKPPVNEKSVSILIAILHDFLPSLDCSKLVKYPFLYSD
jgi:hypothetical protein